MIPEAARRAAQGAYMETLTNLRLSEGGGFKVASQQRRALDAALEAAASHMLAEAKADALREAAELIEPFSGIGMANGATRGDVSRWLRERADMFRPTP